MFVLVSVISTSCNQPPFSSSSDYNLFCLTNVPSCTYSNLNTDVWHNTGKITPRKAQRAFGSLISKISWEIQRFFFSIREWKVNVKQKLRCAIYNYIMSCQVRHSSIYSDTTDHEWTCSTCLRRSNSRLQILQAASAHPPPAYSKNVFLLVPVRAAECIKKKKTPAMKTCFTWKNCACRSPFCLRGAVVASPRPLAGSLNLRGLTQVLSFSFAQHFKNMSMQINTLTVNLMKGG